MLNNEDIKIIYKNENIFPKQLYKLTDCPKQLYLVGNIKLLNKFILAVIGARRCEIESKKYAEKITEGLVKNNVVIISGMARGIDSVAHESCLKMKGKTIAVLGGGFNQIYPKENIRLFYKILEEDGLVISEYAPDIPALPYHFLQRNRIVAALSKGVVLIEAKENSGSITTAKYAQKLKRKLFVLPGAVSNRAFAGSNKLLTEGAKCILKYDDILKDYKKFSENRVINNEITQEKILNTVPDEYLKIYKCISNVPKSSNQISLELNIEINELNSILTLMEIDEYIKQLPGNFFVKI